MLVESQPIIIITTKKIKIKIISVMLFIIILVLFLLLLACLLLETIYFRLLLSWSWLVPSVLPPFNVYQPTLHYDFGNFSRI